MTDAEIIALLRANLANIREDLIKTASPEDSGAADEEDEDERKEDDDQKSATKEVLGREIRSIERKIAWIEANGSHCASPDCENEVEVGRHNLGGVTCPEHMNDEEQILNDRELSK